MDYKSKFEELVRKYIKRDGIEELLRVFARSDFYTAPASTRYHDSHEQGLVIHSIKVFENLLANKDCKYSDETKAIVALFHDICKIGFYEVSERNSKENGKWVKVPYYTVNDRFPVGHGAKSVIMILPIMKLTPDEILAITHHMGAYGLTDYNTLGAALTECPLVLYLQHADMCATYLK